jgi:hypothetical protein
VEAEGVLFVWEKVWSPQDFFRKPNPIADHAGVWVDVWNAMVKGRFFLNPRQLPGSGAPNAVF